MVKVIVLRTAGTNCDIETAHAFRRHSAEVDLVHINEVKTKKKRLSSYHILAIPGGFTYGDDVAAGRILANELKFKIGNELKKFIEVGKLIIGICNGFQVLVKAGLLPDVEIDEQKATLILNDSGKFEDRWVHLKANKNSPCIWTKGIEEIIYLPVAHAEGKFTADKETLEELKKNGQIIFQYVDENGNPAGYPYNPNGSLENIAGICDESGRIIGLMPHPERFLEPSHHPHWQRLSKEKEGDGNLLFKNAVNFAKNHLLPK